MSRRQKLFYIASEEEESARPCRRDTMKFVPIRRYLTICTEEGIISAKKAGIWTKKVTDVKYPAMKWLTSERGRAEKLRAEAERKRLTEQAAALKAVLYPEP